MRYGWKCMGDGRAVCHACSSREFVTLDKHLLAVELSYMQDSFRADYRASAGRQWFMYPCHNVRAKFLRYPEADRPDDLILLE